jgi:hypothetical protein
MKSYQRKRSDQIANLPLIESVTVGELLEQLRQGCLYGCDTVRVTLEPETCVKAGLPFPVSIFVTVDADLFNGAKPLSNKFS